MTNKFNEIREYDRQEFEESRDNYVDPNAPPKSAYDIAVDNGFVGTEQEWLDSLKAPEPKTPYEIAVDNGFVGTQQEWLDSLNGRSAYDAAVDNGFVGTEQEWLDQLSSSGGGGEIGDITYSTKNPTDYLPCDGSKYLQSAYPELFTSIGAIIPPYEDSVLTRDYFVCGGKRPFDVIVSADKTKLAVSHTNQGARFFDVATGNQEAFYSSGFSSYGLDVRPDWSLAVRLEKDFSNGVGIVFFDPATGSEVDSYYSNPTENTSYEGDCKFTSDGRYVAFVHYIGGSSTEDNFHVYDTQTNAPVTLTRTTTMQGSTYAKEIHITPDDAYIILNLNGSFVIFETATWTEVTIDSGYPSPESCGINSDGDFVYKSGNDLVTLTMGANVTYSVETSAFPNPPSSAHTHIAFSKSGKYAIFSGQLNGDTQIVDLETKELFGSGVKSTGSPVVAIDDNDTFAFPDYISPYNVAIWSPYNYDLDSEFITPTVSASSNSALVKAFIKGDKQ